MVLIVPEGWIFSGGFNTKNELFKTIFIRRFTGEFILALNPQTYYDYISAHLLPDRSLKSFIISFKKSLLCFGLGFFLSFDGSWTIMEPIRISNILIKMQ